MKIKIIGVLFLFLLASFGLEAQTLFVPGTLSGIGNSTTSGIGIGTSTPRGRLEIMPICTTAGSFPTLLLSKPGSPACSVPWSYGNYFEAREYNIGNITYNTRFIINTAGRVGVGTGTPAQTFHVVGNTYTTGNSTIGIIQPTTAAVKLHVHDGAMMVSGPNASGGPMILFSDDISSMAFPNGRWGIEYVANQGLNFWKPWNPGGSGGNHYLFIKDDGKVGIGIDPAFTSSSMPNSMPNGYKLFVKDGILTEKVKVSIYNTTNWADYVFEPDYQRNSLEYVDDFVKTNKHLPHMPSADEVCADGLDVAQMDAALLRQIEELWLHVIDLKKENEELKKLVDAKIKGHGTN